MLSLNSGRDRLYEVGGEGRRCRRFGLVLGWVWCFGSAH